jgi:hypothetical protein
LKCCELGFILAGDEGAFEDGQALAVDLIYLGMILDVVHSWADDTMCEATYETPPNMCMSITKRLKEKWQRIQSIVFYKAECLQKVIQEVMHKQATDLCSEQEETEQEQELEQEQAGSKKKGAIGMETQKGNKQGRMTNKKRKWWCKK